MSTASRSSDAGAPPSTNAHILRRTFVLRSFDEARVVLSDLYSGGKFELQRGQSFNGEVDVFSAGPLRVVSGSWPSGWSGGAPMVHDRYILSLAAHGGARGAHGGEEFSLSPDREGCLFSPGRSAHFEAGAGLQGRTITLDRGALEAHFVTLTGRSLHGPIHFNPALNLEGGPGAVVEGIAKVLRSEVAREGRSPQLIAALREALMTSLLSTLEHSAASFFAGEAPRVAPRQVRRAEEYIDAHAGEPLTLADIAGAVGVSARSLQVTFKEYRGISPMEAVRRRRFDLVRQRLMKAGPEGTVSSLVSELILGGATGRFSVEYKRRFGESPSETLARARGGSRETARSPGRGG